VFDHLEELIKVLTGEFYPYTLKLEREKLKYILLNFKKYFIKI